MIYCVDESNDDGLGPLWAVGEKEGKRSDTFLFSNFNNLIILILNV